MDPCSISTLRPHRTQNCLTTKYNDPCPRVPLLKSVANPYCVLERMQNPRSVDKPIYTTVALVAQSHHHIGKLTTSTPRIASYSAHIALRSQPSLIQSRHCQVILDGKVATKISSASPASTGTRLRFEIPRRWLQNKRRWHFHLLSAAAGSLRDSAPLAQDRAEVSWLGPFWMLRKVVLSAHCALPGKTVR
jgi:hypothetical protein